jgi:hypothetical protein
MRYKYFLRKHLSNGEVQRLPFEPVHFQGAGIPFAQMGGMPVLEAYQLVNSLNISQPEQKYVYALEQ